MKICVLQPDYSTTDVDYKNYDPPRDLSYLLPDHRVDHIFLNKLTTYRQLKDLSRKGYDIFVNLCEGYLEWEVPSIDVIHSLDLLNLPYTGPNAILYDPPKPLMKYVAYCAGVKTPPAVEVTSSEGLDEVTKKLRFPLFVKPAKAGDSLGIDEHSHVTSRKELEMKVNDITKQYSEVLVEEYIEGREFTVLVAADPTNIGSPTVYKPIEYIFPNGKAFKTYRLKTSELHPDSNIPSGDPAIERELQAAASKIFVAFGGVGYARLDFRMDRNNVLYFLEINFTCSAFYVDGYEGSADFVLNNDPAGKHGFLKQIIAEGIARHKSKQKKYVIQGPGLVGYGIFSTRDITKGEVVFEGEGVPQRIISKRFVNDNWTERQKEDFRHYAYPISDEVYILWDQKPENWAPQNHSCSPNTGYEGLNVIALGDIKKGDELTIDYASFLDDTMEPFLCQCGSKNCRKVIVGEKGNRVARFRTA
jgi:D-alanine-D-alanine ligase